MTATDVKASLGPQGSAVQAALRELSQARLLARLWAKDHRIWRSQATEITNRLGWLTVAEQMLEKASALQVFAKSIRDEGCRDVVLLGMGGSSLGPEVLRCTFGAAKGWPRSWVLDSTVPGAVRQVTKAITPAKTLFLVASKSGGTIEVMSLFMHFWKLVAEARGGRGGAQFVAITDPATSLGELAQAKGFRTTFTNPADIGGRYSVLSYFGLVPAALLGVDMERLLRRGVEMAKRCAPAVPAHENPGAFLGTVMGLLGRGGRDKVTLVTSPKIRTFGLWAEQLLAESTGKEGKGLVPIAEEPLGAPSAYGDDRLFVYLQLQGDANAASDRHVLALERSGHPVVRLTLRDPYDLGAEFFRWEFATAVAGHFLGIHPFDQPNVQESKENTGRILKEFQQKGRLPEIGTSWRGDGMRVVADVAAKAAPSRYLAILAYLTPSKAVETAIAKLRRTLLSASRLPTTAGYGPRYLHSTGQLHKGGTNTGLFLQLVEEMAPDVAIPGAPYSFATLARAQAVGDFQSLRAHDREVVCVTLGKDPVKAIAGMAAALSNRTTRRRITGRSKTMRATRKRTTR